ncbi:hypothetical protein ACI3EY_08920 [Ornithinimicrobium sp. LYQ92]|uniref:hypothetical protein n=1 Tax=Serinicoccus sp. LYQ92 TaxID=3378798 RepID=UPI003851D550
MPSATPSGTAARRPASGGGLVAGVFVMLLALVLLGGALSGALPRIGAWTSGLTAPCSVVVDGEGGADVVPLDREQARAATAAAAWTLRTGQAPAEVLSRTGAELPDGVVDAVLGARAGTALTCRSTEADAGRQQITDTGLTPRAQAVREALEAEFGELSLGGFAPGGVDSGHGAESTHYEGRAVDVFYRPVTEASLDQGWVLAQWLVAHGEGLTVQYVIFDDHWWGVRQSARGWQPYEAPGGSSDPVLRHRDHVHVDVVRGD